MDQPYKKIRKKQVIAEEYMKGLLDPTYIIEGYLKTIDLTRGGFVPFKLFPRQKEICQGFEKYRHNLVTKPRQTGVSTTTAGYLAVKAAYADPESPEQIIIIANKFASAKKFLTLIRLFLGQLPKWVWGDLYDHKKSSEGHIDGKGSSETIKLVNGSIIKAVATSPDALRGWTPTFLVVDEAAYVETFAKELYTASMAALSTGGKMIIISTPNGKDELYYRTYANAKAGKNGFNVIELKWYEDPRYNKELEWQKTDDKGKIDLVKEIEFTAESFRKMEEAGYKPIAPWYTQMCSSLNWDKLSIARELDVKFEGSAGTVVDEEWIRYHEKNNVIEPIRKEYKDKLHIFENPIEGHEYIMGVDVSSGSGADYSSFVIINTVTGNLAVEYVDKIRPEYLADIVDIYGRLYNSLCVIDAGGGYGDLLIFKLQEMDFPHLYYGKSGANDHLKKYTKNKQDKYKLQAGYKIGSKRPQIVGKLTQYIENNELIIRSKRFIAELETFVFINGRPDHMSGYHDDIIFAAALALWVLETEFKSLEKAKNQTKAILSVLAGTKSKNYTQPQIIKRSKSTVYNTKADDYRWLLGN